MAGNIRARAEGLDQGRHPRRILARRVALTFAAALLVAAAGTAQTASEQELDAAVAAIRGLKDEQRFDDAHTRFAAIVDRTPDRGIASAWLFFEGAEIRRRLFDWQQSMAWLDRTEAALVDVPPSPDRTTLATLVSIGRASVQIERGLPDLAHAHLQAAQAMAPADDRFLGNRITWLELRMHRALEQGQAARDCLQGFERKFGPDAFLRLTAAVALMQDPRTTAAELAQVDEWIDAARTADLSADERSLVSTLYVLRRLATRDHGAARSELDAALQRLPAGVNERRVSLEALALRLANDAGDAPERVRDRQLQLRSTWDQLLDKLAHQPPAAMGLGAMFPLERQRALAEMIRSHVRHDGVDGPRLALQLVLDIGTLGSLARTLQAGPCTVADVQRSLTGPGRGLLVYAPGPERSWAFVVDAHAVQTFELGVRTSTIARLSRQLVDSIHLARHGAADDRRRQADAERTLAELLLPSALAAAITPLERLTIVGLDSHGYVPFEALRRPDGRRLGTAHAIAYLPSANLGCWLARNRPAPTPAASIDLRLVACPEVVPTGSPTLQPLAFTRTERDELLHAASAANARVFLGSTATLDAALGHPTSLLEIVAHGVRDERRSDPQGIVFGDGQTAWTNDFATRQLPSWVVFAACRAGRGRFRPGDDGRHLLGGASLLAGARAVLAPHLEIDYRTTLALLGALNRGLLHDGVPFDEALRRARVAIGGDDAPVDAFLLHLHGLGDVPLVAAAGGEPRPATITQEEGGRTAWLPWLLAAAAIAAVGATVVLRRRRT